MNILEYLKSASTTFYLRGMPCLQLGCGVVYSWVVKLLTFKHYTNLMYFLNQKHNSNWSIQVLLRHTLWTLKESQIAYVIIKFFANQREEVNSRWAIVELLGQRGHRSPGLAVNQCSILSWAEEEPSCIQFQTWLSYNFGFYCLEDG